MTIIPKHSLRMTTTDQRSRRSFYQDDDVNGSFFFHSITHAQSVLQHGKSNWAGLDCDSQDGISMARHEKHCEGVLRINFLVPAHRIDRLGLFFTPGMRT